MVERSARELADQAISEWRRGDYYDAHETLEDFAEALEDVDFDHDVALALVHVAASLHKAKENVGPAAVPGKLSQALAVLDRAPSDWQGLDIGSLREELHALHGRIAGLAKGQAVELPERLPMLRRF